MSIEQSEAEGALRVNSFERTHSTKKALEYRSPHNGKFLYLRTDVGIPAYARIVVHPAEVVSTLIAIAGVELNSPNELQHGSNLGRFPTRKNRGKTDIHYGRALNISSASALAAFAVAFHKL